MVLGDFLLRQNNNDSNPHEIILIFLTWIRYCTKITRIQKII